MKATEVYAVAIAALTGESVFMWGGPGQGKSSLVRRGFASLGWGVHVIRLNTTPPHHLSGSPLPSPDGLSVVYVPPSWVLELNKLEHSIVLIDDVTCASPLAQAAALGLMDEREVGGVKLKGVTIAAANPNAGATARFDLDAAAANRCIHIFITSDGASFAAAAEENFPPPKMPKLRPNWLENIPRKRKLVTDFLTSPEGEKLVNAMPAKMMPTTVAWPSERTWEKFWRMLAVCDSIELASLEGINLLEVRRLLCIGCVGEGAYKEYLKYYTHPVDADITKALRNYRNFTLPETGDAMYGLLIGVSHRLAGAQLDDTQWNNAWGLLERIWNTSYRDYAITFAMDLLSLNRAQFKEPKFCEQVKKALAVAA